MDAMDSKYVADVAMVQRHLCDVGRSMACEDSISCVSVRHLATKLKSTEEWQSALWIRWPSESMWPAKLDIYEAAAYLRVSPHTIRRFLAVARDGKARLAHQRVGAVYRIRRVDLDAIGSVAGRF